MCVWPLCRPSVCFRPLILQAFKKQISIPDDLPQAEVYLDALSDLTLEDVTRFERKTLLNVLVPDPLADHIHILAASVSLFLSHRLTLILGYDSICRQQLRLLQDRYQSY